MARTTITAQAAPGSRPTLQPTAASLTLVQAAPSVAADGVQFALSGRQVLLAHNTDVSAQTVTISSVANSQGRTGDITAYSIPTLRVAVFGPFDADGWRQADGMLYAVASHIGVKFSVITIP